MKLTHLLLLAGAFALGFAWPAATQQNSATSLGSLTVQDALRHATVPVNTDITMLYRSQNGDAVYTQTYPFMFAVSASQPSLGGL